MSTTAYVLWRHKKNINNFWLKKRLIWSFDSVWYIDVPYGYEKVGYALMYTYLFTLLNRKILADIFV